jgi:predicted metal-binding protein
VADRDDCVYAVGMNAAALITALHPDAVLVAGCMVRKQPDACPACALNEDCTRIPLHDSCHCEAEPVALGLGG